MLITSDQEELQIYTWPCKFDVKLKAEETLEKLNVETNV